MVDSRAAVRIGVRSRGVHTLDARNKNERQERAEPRRLRWRRKAAIERHHHAGEQQHERQDARQQRELVPHGQNIGTQQLGIDTGLGHRPLGVSVFAAKAPDRIGGEQGNQHQGRADGGQEQPAERLLGGDRIENHGDRWRQQDTERAAGRDDAGREARRIAALAHFRDPGRADGRAGGGRGARHGGKQRAGEHIGDAEAARNALHPGVQRAIEILARRRAADGGTFQDEQRNGQERDRGHFLVDVLRDGIDRTARHEHDHEQGRGGPERKRDGHAGEHHQKGHAAVQQTNRQDRHGMGLRRSSATAS